MTIIRRNLFIASVYIDVISVIFCFMIFCPIGYTTAVIQTEPAKTICALSYNPIIQIILIITVLYTMALIGYEHSRHKSDGELGDLNSDGQND
jgi:hypothetical protein